MTRERALALAYVYLAADETRHAELMMRSCAEMAVHWAERAEYWRARLHRCADVAEEGARVVAATDPTGVSPSR